MGSEVERREWKWESLHRVILNGVNRMYVARRRTGLIEDECNDEMRAKRREMKRVERRRRVKKRVRIEE